MRIVIWIWVCLRVPFPRLFPGVKSSQKHWCSLFIRNFGVLIPRYSLIRRNMREDAAEKNEDGECAQIFVDWRAVQ